MGVLILGAFIVAFGFAIGFGGTVTESIAHRKVRKELEQKELQLAAKLSFGEKALAEQEERLTKTFEKRERELANREKELTQRMEEFRRGFLPGRRWLAALVAEAESARDGQLWSALQYKDRPAWKAAEVVAAIRAEKRALKEELTFLKYQLTSYEEYFPFLEEFRDVILDERVPLGSGRDNEDALRKADPCLQYLAKEEYERLSISERNQRALDCYVARTKSNWEIGRFYERFVGYAYEKEGWAVDFNGAVKGYEDFGRDLICKRDGIVVLVQAKCWSRNRTIHEKHIFQLYGTCVQYRLTNPGVRVVPVFTCTTDLSDVASMVARELGVIVHRWALPKAYPMIKCNVNPSTKERIYHLPFDQQYDRTAIGTVPGECYVQTVAEAERLGFRRAWKHVAWQS